jgi:hypothetical protein
MLQTLYRVGLFAALFGLMFVPGDVWGQKGRPRLVHDEAKLFSKEAIEQANKTIVKIKEKHGKDLFIETIESGEKDKDARAKWTKARFNDFGIDGIYIVISKDPSFFRDFVGDNTRSNGYFTTGNIEKMNEILKGGILKKDKRDEALIEVANYTLEVMNEHARAKGNTPQPKKNQPVAVAPVAAQNHPPARDVDGEKLPDWVGYLCIGLAVLFVVWIVFAIIRAMTGAMGGGGYGYGGGGYGGGGGGFLTGMLGGMFGAMAGMWMYNNMFGGHASYGQNGQVNWGGGDQGAAGGAAPYEADTAEGGTGGGGDDDAGGGGGGDDAGGGAWGDKEDAGGGGDDGGGGGGWFGGGGSDAGGGDAGGGGDWGGGGGGGDFGGGGGGGGDW